MAGGYSLEPVFRVWNDKTGERIEVCNDGDGLDLVSIRWVSDHGAPGSEVTMPEEVVPLLIEALERMMSFRAERAKALEPARREPEGG